MYIEKINGPEDVKKLTVDEMTVMAGEMREALLKRASIHGGHFGPNFGMRSHCIMYSSHQKTRSYMMCHIRLTHTRC